MPTEGPGLSLGGLDDRPRREQPPDQFGPPAKVLLLRSLQPLVGEFGFDLFEHQWQRHAERDEGLLHVGGGHFVITATALAS
jgi:hypothetical protein